MSAVNIVKSSVPAWNSGNGTVNTTPEQLPTWPAFKHVVVRAHADNTDEILVGATAGAAAAGFRLAAGESQEIPIDDADKIFVVSASGDQDYSWLAV